MNTNSSVLSLAIALALPAVAPSAPEGRNVAVWDTGLPSATASEAGGRTFPPSATATSFTGDAMMGNGRVVVAVRKGGKGAEVYAVRDGVQVSRARLVPMSARGEPAVRLLRAALVENGPGGACLEARYATDRGLPVWVRFRLKPDEVAVEAAAVRGRVGATRLRVECVGRYAVLPDFFADDLRLDAVNIPVRAASVPSDSFILNMAGAAAAGAAAAGAAAAASGAGDSVVVCVFENRNQDVRMTLAGEGEGRNFTGSEIEFGKGQRVWVALLEGRGIWNATPVRAEDAGKVLPLEWKMPFPAVWRTDFTKADDLTDSWEMLLQEKQGGEYRKPGWVVGGDDVPLNRKRWTTVLGEFEYPCWSDPAGLAWLQPIDSEEVKYAGPVLIYPINRVERTPLDAWTVVDVMRNSLGVGPCEYVLDLEGQKDSWPGEATCGVRDTITPIYERGEQVAKKAEVDKTIDAGLYFVRYIRGRINQYVAFGHELRNYIAVKRRSSPRQAKLLYELDRLALQIDVRVAARRKYMRTPEDVAKMNKEFRRDVLGYEGPDAMERCKTYTKALVRVGSNQDELVGECRWVVKALRQRAGILVATDPKFGPIARHVREMTEKVLRKPAGHEGARH